ncbi:MAG: hypothetical protein LBP28_03520, partial [Coriobacteriales bacterium]|nr:hypothetical protein [Coriobacteriales bacterium]
MRIRWYALATAALIAAGFAALLLFIPPVQTPQNDTVAINDLRHHLAQDFERVRAEGSAALPGAADGAEGNAKGVAGGSVAGGTADTLAYSVFDSDGRLLASTSESPAHDLNEAIAHGNTIVDVAVGSRVVGKLAIDNNIAASLNSHRTRLQLAFTVMLTLLALVLTLLLVRVHRSVLKPFRTLESFAANIAAGKLDIPLS